MWRGAWRVLPKNQPKNVEEGSFVAEMISLPTGTLKA
jgi:hypothetical protein